MIDILESESWKINYYGKRKIYILDFLEENDLNDLKALGIIIENRKYTRCEYDRIMQEFWKYSDDEEEKYRLSLDEKGISKERYNEIQEKFDKVEEKYIYQQNDNKQFQ